MSICKYSGAYLSTPFGKAIYDVMGVTAKSVAGVKNIHRLRKPSLAKDYLSAKSAIAVHLEGNTSIGSTHYYLIFFRVPLRNNNRGVSAWTDCNSRHCNIRELPNDGETNGVFLVNNSRKRPEQVVTANIPISSGVGLMRFEGIPKALVDLPSDQESIKISGVGRPRVVNGFVASATILGFVEDPNFAVLTSVPRTIQISS